MLVHIPKLDAPHWHFTVWIVMRFVAIIVGLFAMVVVLPASIAGYVGFALAGILLATIIQVVRAPFND